MRSHTIGVCYQKWFVWKCVLSKTCMYTLEESVKLQNWICSLNFTSHPRQFVALHSGK